MFKDECCKQCRQVKFKGTKTRQNGPYKKHLETEQNDRKVKRSIKQ